MTAPMMAFEQLTAPLLARTPLGRFATPDEIAPAVLFLASPAGALHHRPDARRRRRLLGRRLTVASGRARGDRVQRQGMSAIIMASGSSTSST